jgi:hypothetical protein
MVALSVSSRVSAGCFGLWSENDCETSLRYQYRELE